MKKGLVVLLAVVFVLVVGSLSFSFAGTCADKAACKCGDKMCPNKEVVKINAPIAKDCHSKELVTFTDVKVKNFHDGCGCACNTCHNGGHCKGYTCYNHYHHDEYKVPAYHVCYSDCYHHTTFFPGTDRHACHSASHCCYHHTCCNHAPCCGACANHCVKQFVPAPKDATAKEAGCKCGHCGCSCK